MYLKLHVFQSIRVPIYQGHLNTLEENVPSDILILLSKMAEQYFSLREHPLFHKLTGEIYV